MAQGPNSHNAVKNNKNIKVFSIVHQEGFLNNQLNYHNSFNDIQNWNMISMDIHNLMIKNIICSQ